MAVKWQNSRLNIDIIREVLTITQLKALLKGVNTWLTIVFQGSLDDSLNYSFLRVNSLKIFGCKLCTLVRSEAAEPVAIICQPRYVFFFRSVIFIA